MEQDIENLKARLMNTVGEAHHSLVKRNP